MYFRNTFIYANLFVQDKYQLYAHKNERRVPNSFFVCNWLKLGTMRMAFDNFVRNENDIRLS